MNSELFKNIFLTVFTANQKTVNYGFKEPIYFEIFELFLYKIERRKTQQIGISMARGEEAKKSCICKENYYELIYSPFWCHPVPCVADPDPNNFAGSLSGSIVDLELESNIPSLTNRTSPIVYTFFVL